MNQDEAKGIFLQALPELSEPLKSAVEFALANWHKLNRRESVKLCDLPHEKWRDVVGYEGLYQVSNFGRIKHFWNDRETIRKISKNYKGYSVVKLSKNNQGDSFLVHVLVARAFFSKPKDKHEINHRIADKENNGVFNLEWITHAENMRHASKMGLLKNKDGLEAPRAKLTKDDVIYIRKQFIKGDNEFGAHALSRKFNITPTSILDVVNYRTYKDVV